MSFKIQVSGLKSGNLHPGVERNTVFGWKCVCTCMHQRLNTGIRPFVILFSS